MIEKLKKIENNKIIDKNYILETIATEIENILKKREDLFIKNNEYPQVLMFVGVNGSGKTTTIGKLINNLKHNKKLLIVACDTFRAAAVDQLKEWSNRNDVDFLQGLTLYLSREHFNVISLNEHNLIDMVDSKIIDENQ